MKRILYFVLLAFLAVGCIQEQAVTILDVPSEITLKASASEEKINIVASGDWSAVSSKDWLGVSSSSGSAGSYTLTITVNANNGYDSRSAEITITSDDFYHKISVTQEGKKGLVLNTNELFVGSEGEEITIPFNTNEEFEIQVDDNCKDWVSVVSTKAMTAHSVVLSIAPNETNDIRMGTVHIVTASNRQTVTITQSPMEGFVVTTTSYEISSDGGEIKVPVKANVEFDYEVLDSGMGWITASKTQANGLDEYYLVLQVSSNESYDGRIGQVRVSGDGKESIVTVSQGQLDALIVAATSFEIGSSGGQVTIPVQANVEYESHIVSGSEWMSIAVGTKGLVSSSVVVDVQANEGTDGRSGQIRVVGAGKETVITITQNAVDELTVGVTSYDIGKEGGQLNVSVESNVEYEYEVLSNGAGWITASKNADNTGLTLTVSPNATYNSRMGQVKITGAGKESIITVTQAGQEGGTDPELDTAVNLSAQGTANSYIVSTAGTYKFSTVQGNSNVSVGTVAAAEVLWETFGTDAAPAVGDLVPYVKYQDGAIFFTTSGREGNALIAAKDADGTILWSWHIWMTDAPADQVYNNGAGTMMDRNLGATSATPGDVGALGLMYQWGRKDPFLGSSSITEGAQAKSTSELTDTESHAVASSVNTGTIAYATANPLTYIKKNENSDDWYYSSGVSTDKTRWQSEKTIYDPCPVGYRVPDGRYGGVWEVAFNNGFISGGEVFDAVNMGYNFGKGGTTSHLTESGICWYPSTGSISAWGTLSNGSYGGPSDDYRGYWWSCTAYDDDTYGQRAGYFTFGNEGSVWPASAMADYRAEGFAVRCFKENSAVEPEPEIDMSAATNLSEVGTANSYIVSKEGTYKFSAVQGNSSASVGTVASVEVLWETFGTSTAPNKKDLISAVKYSDNAIYFMATNKKGNALIAAKDSEGTILWSWHIWMTDAPADQVYNNGAGTMMDRNLGATSATPGDVGALGLMYQWGRKDPFLGSSSISTPVQAVSTSELTNSASNVIESNTITGTIVYATSHPTTFITYNGNNSDWYYSGDSSTDETRWQSTKTVYDPCPVGYSVPSGSYYDGVWSRAFGTSQTFNEESFDATNYGFNFSKGSTTNYLMDEGICWYPAAGMLQRYDGSISATSSWGDYWSYATSYSNAKNLHFNASGQVKPEELNSRSEGRPVRCYKENSATEPEKEIDLSSAADLSVEGTANSYIVSEEGTYKFPTVKGNSNESVGTVQSTVVLWETYGTETAPNKKDLISGVKYSDNAIYFTATEKRGNALIAAKDADGKILWSWHIWMTEQPVDQEYVNGAGIMMDRNLGATSAAAGSVGALGLKYQWGRKDPFLSSSTTSESATSSDIRAASTMTEWPSVQSSASEGTVEYATTHPTTFITRNETNYDWYYSGDTSTDNTRWQSEKTIYDPCPAGYRVPDGGENGVWAKALGTYTYTMVSNYDSTNHGFTFTNGITNKYMTDRLYCWYPTTGELNGYDNSLDYVGTSGEYWSCTPYPIDMESSSDYEYEAYYFSLFYNGGVSSYNGDSRAMGYSVRCFKENSAVEPEPEIDMSAATNLSEVGTANSYIVSKEGTYKFSTVQGNSSTSVGSVASVEVLWETFGTSTAPNKKDLIPAVKYSDNAIYFTTTNRKGNALIAAKDAEGIILWSWHIWMTDAPTDQIYKNNAGIMMDRNLGATSAVPGEALALGLLYQWGRKDPFLGSSSISEGLQAVSTNEITNTSSNKVESDATNGTIAYATAHPTIFITNDESGVDWLYPTGSSDDKMRWHSDKTIYDPCPVGYRVPDGGVNDVWGKAFGLLDLSYVDLQYGYSFNYSSYDETDKGINFGKNDSEKYLTEESTCWYPDMYGIHGTEGIVVADSNYWSCTNDDRGIRSFFFYPTHIYVAHDQSTLPVAKASAVRCIRENSATPEP